MNSDFLKDIDSAQCWFYGNLDTDDFNETREFYENLSGIKLDKYYTTSANGKMIPDNRKIYQLLDKWWRNLSKTEQLKIFQQCMEEYG